MPPRPRAPRSRVSTIRRPRVAGRTPAHRGEGTDHAGHGTAPGTGPLETLSGSRGSAPAVENPAAAVPTTQAESPGPESGALAAAVPEPAIAKPTPVGGTAKVSTTRAGSPGPESEALTAPAPETASPAGTTAKVSTVKARSTASSEPADTPAPDDRIPGGLLRGLAVPAPGDRVAGAWLRGRAVPVLAVALVLLTGLAVFFGIADARLRGTPSASNAALVDVGATAEANGQLSDALETVYSYDFTRLDENERAARDVITPAFGADFDSLFAQVRELAPQRQAVVSATVQLSAIQDIEGDRAVLVAFMDQRATTATEGAAAQQLAASGRLTVTGERVDGRWKIAGVESR